MLNLDARVDLHMHSTFSDGSENVPQLIQLAQKLNIGLLALTDHDTTAGIPQAQQLALQANIKFIPGVEISGKFKQTSCHILGYFIDFEDPTFIAALNDLQNARNMRNQKILDKLQSIGVDIEATDLKKNWGKSTVIGRPHIASLLVEKKYASNISEAFYKYLGVNGVAYFDKEIFSPSEAVAKINNSKGISVLAHPCSLRLNEDELKKFVSQLVEDGLGGIEVYNSAHSLAQVAQYKAIAEEFGLLASGGSDFHGTHKKNIFLGKGFGGNYTLLKHISAKFLEKAY